MQKNTAHLLKLLKRQHQSSIIVSVEHPETNTALIKHPTFPAFHLMVFQSTISSPSFYSLSGKNKNKKPL